MFQRPKIAETTQTPIDVALRPNFSANTAESGINAAKHSVATN